MGKALAIVQSNAGEQGTIQLVVRADGLQPAVIRLAATADGTGDAPAQVELAHELVGVQNVAFGVPTGAVPTLPRDVRVTYTDTTVG